MKFIHLPSVSGTVYYVNVLEIISFNDVFGQPGKTAFTLSKGYLIVNGSAADWEQTIIMLVNG